MKIKWMSALAQVFLVVLLIIGGCRRVTTYLTPSGLEYQLFPGHGTGLVAGSGATVKLRYELRHGDSILQSTTGRMPRYQQLIPGLVFPYSPMEVLGMGVRPGDSLVVWQRVDSMLAKGMLRTLPKGWGKADRFEARMKILAVYPFNYAAGDSLVMRDKEEEARKLLALEKNEGLTRVRRWLAERKIDAVPTACGTFVEVVKEGKGAKVDSSVELRMRYVCKTFGGRVLDSNEDTAFHKPEPYVVKVADGRLPEGLSGSILGLRVGSKIRVYMPAATGMKPDNVIARDGIGEPDRVWEVEL